MSCICGNYYTILLYICLESQKSLLLPSVGSPVMQRLLKSPRQQSSGCVTDVKPRYLGKPLGCMATSQNREAYHCSNPCILRGILWPQSCIDQNCSVFNPGQWIGNGKMPKLRVPLSDQERPLSESGWQLIFGKGMRPCRAKTKLGFPFRDTPVHTDSAGKT